MKPGSRQHFNSRKVTIQYPVDRSLVKMLNKHHEIRCQGSIQISLVAARELSI
jgi:hypothetical protein